MQRLEHCEKIKMSTRLLLVLAAVCYFVSDFDATRYANAMHNTRSTRPRYLPSSMDSLHLTVNYRLTLFNRRTVNSGVTVLLGDLVARNQLLQLMCETILPDSFSYVTVHGFPTGSENEWAHQFKDRILAVHNANVFIVSWSETFLGSKTVLQEDFRVQEIVSNFIANFFNRQAVHDKIDFGKTHFIGHSVGARIANNAVLKINKPVSHLIALDPNYDSSGSPRVVMRTTTHEYQTSLMRIIGAVFTTVFHSDADNLGTFENCGSVDVYLNGGYDQPGCEDAVVHPDLISVTNCNHEFATKFFKSIALHELAKADNLSQAEQETHFAEEYHKCFPMAYKCDSFDSFTKGHCGSCLSRNNQEARSSCVHAGLPGPLINYTTLPRKTGLISVHALVTDSDGNCMFTYRVIVGIARASRIRTRRASISDDKVFVRIPLSDRPGHVMTVELTPRTRYLTLRGELENQWGVSHLSNIGLTRQMLSRQHLDYRSILVSFKSKFAPGIQPNNNELEEAIRTIKYVDVWGSNFRKVEFVCIDYMSHPDFEVRRAHSFLSTRFGLDNERLGQDSPFIEYFATFNNP